MTAISLTPGLTEVTMFGGTSSPHPYDCIAATTIISFGEFIPYLHHVMWMIGWGFGFHEMLNLIQCMEKIIGSYIIFD